MQSKFYRACRFCREETPDRHYPGCHDHCPDYLSEKAISEADKARQYMENEIVGYIRKSIDDVKRGKK